MARCDVAAVNRLHKQMRQEDPAATRSAAAERFRNMDREARAALEEAVRGGGRRSAAAPPSSPIPAEARSHASWSPSDGKWPVSPAVLAKAADGRGLASWGAECREARRHSSGHIVSLDEGLIVPGCKFYHRFSCAERHPGLCHAKDSDIYVDALALAKNLETFCGDSTVG
eukprot:6939677-Pyramimonas_sp.AAC.1